jgi:hypothetical protein
MRIAVDFGRDNIPEVPIVVHYRDNAVSGYGKGEASDA